MNNKFVYHNYLNNNKRYYFPNSSKFDETEYIIERIPDSYVVQKTQGSPWKSYTNKKRKIKPQGWKIHISSTLNDSTNILEDVSAILFSLDVTFKHIISKDKLYKSYSKEGDRRTSGKFITIYPCDDHQFLLLLETIHKKISIYEQGPYILSDKCWKNSNVFYRYGGFISLYNEFGELCIRDKNGCLIPDQRNPFYYAPEFVKGFDQHLDTLNKQLNEGSNDNKLDAYQIDNAIRFSNGGGIYSGTRKADNLKVIIKEARPQIGLDGNQRDAIARQEVEYSALNTLAPVKGIVNVIDYFKTWKHGFLVEEFVEGVSLQTWIALNYPFYKENDINHYADDVRIIVKNLLKVVQRMHAKDVGMGDLQPQNIIVNEHLDLTLIDFETAQPKESLEKPTLHTLGFSNKSCKNHMERDWYAIKKILYYLFLPLGPISEIDKNIQAYHQIWLQEHFGEEVSLFTDEIQSTCNYYLPFSLDNELVPVNNLEYKEASDLTVVAARLREGVALNFSSDKYLIHGDVRQYELEDGAMNVLYGGAGAALVFNRSEVFNHEIHEWINNHLLPNTKTFDQLGLFTGLSGVASVLYENNYKKESLNIFYGISDTLDYSFIDISLRSGAAGIGLTFISLYLEEKENDFLLTAERIADGINNFINEERELSVNDISSTQIGIIDGWSGVSIFFSALFAITKNRIYLYRATELIEKDLKQTKEDEKAELIHTIDDRQRLLPYLSGGSIGIALAIDFLDHVSGKENFQHELKLIINQSSVRCTFNGGLFDGAGSFLLLATLIRNDQEKYNETIQSLTELINLFLIKNEHHMLYPGNLGYRLSDDIYSGSSGIILAIEAIKRRNSLYWLPIINPISLYNQTEFNTRKRNGIKT